MLILPFKNLNYYIPNQRFMIKKKKNVLHWIIYSFLVVFLNKKTISKIEQGEFIQPKFKDISGTIQL